MVTASAVLIVLGVIVGILNVTDKEVTKFIIAAIGLTVGASAVASLGAQLGVIQVDSIFTLFGLFVAGALFIPALKAVYSVSKD